jgi:hypothetical protein
MGKLLSMNEIIQKKGAIEYSEVVKCFANLDIKKQKELLEKVSEIIPGDDNLAERINTLFSYRAHIQMESLNDTLALEKKLESDIIHTIMVGLSLKEKYYNMMVASIMQICEE